MIVLDASVLIAHLDPADVHHARARALLLEVADEPFAASAITLAEVLVGPTRAGQHDRAVAALDRLEVRSIAIGDDAPSRLARLRAETNLKIPDCCALLAAEQAHTALATFDEGLAVAARDRSILVHPERGDAADDVG